MHHEGERETSGSGYPIPGGRGKGEISGHKAAILGGGSSVLPPAEQKLQRSKNGHHMRVWPGEAPSSKKESTVSRQKRKW